MKKKKNKINEEELDLDLSIIKENDLDDTASFTDLMSHKEKKERKKIKRENLENNLDDLVLKDNDVEDTNEFKTDELSSQIGENKIVETDDTDEINNLENTNLQEDNIVKDVKEPKERTNITNTIFISFGIIGSLAYFIYSILYTELQNNKNYLLINGISIVILIFNYCLMTISGKKLALFLAILNYLIIVGFITFNALIYLKII